MNVTQGSIVVLGQAVSIDGNLHALVQITLGSESAFLTFEQVGDLSTALTAEKANAMWAFEAAQRSSHGAEALAFGLGAALSQGRA